MKRECMWCRRSLDEKHMRKWNDRWECKAWQTCGRLLRRRLRLKGLLGAEST